jgi:tRNA pseudouridine13 synthase
MPTTISTLPNWPRAHGAPVGTAIIRINNSDFQVSEQLGYELTGDGEHIYLLVEKDGANTNWVARQLAAYSGFRAADISYSGLKDRNAITRQWFSIRAPGKEEIDWAGFVAEGVTIVKHTRHNKKLRRGAHTGNHFRICLRNLTANSEQLTRRLQQIAIQGVPNYFGEQRFGHGGSNLKSAEALFSGKRLAKPIRSLALSAARSFLFNEILAARVSAKTWDQLLPGDCANLDGSGSVFKVAEPDELLRQRCTALDIHPSGCLWGRGQLLSDSQVADIELGVMALHQSLADGIVAKGVDMSRRALRLRLRDFSWEQSGDSIWLEFFLGRGSFATAVLGEILDYTDGSQHAHR